MHKQTQEGSTEEMTMDTIQDFASKTLLQYNVYAEWVCMEPTWSYFSDRLRAVIGDIC